MARVLYTLYSFFIKNQLQLQIEFELIISCQKSPIQVNLDASALSKLKLNAAKRQLTVPFFWRVLQIIDCFENDLHV